MILFYLDDEIKYNTDSNTAEQSPNQQTENIFMTEVSQMIINNSKIIGINFSLKVMMFIKVRYQWKDQIHLNQVV